VSTCSVCHSEPCICGRPSFPSPISHPRDSQPTPSGPYRGGHAAAPDESEGTCPYCSNRIPALVRVCPHCDVRLENVRCGSCYSLQQPGSFNCTRCGQALELEPMLDATDAPCPRCNKPLEAAAGDDARMHECPHCGGHFVSKDVLAELLVRAEVSGPFAEPTKSAIPALEQVRYVSCPLCHSSMNRMNFGRVSGVIVDVCKQHGTWFDGGELTRVIAFAANGGLAKTRAREAADKKQEQKDREKANHDFAVMHAENQAYEFRREIRRTHWEDILRDWFFW
jgi:Zn-finger nucleic acid-binding protein